MAADKHTTGNTLTRSLWIGVGALGLVSGVALALALDTAGAPNAEAPREPHPTRAEPERLPTAGPTSGATGEARRDPRRERIEELVAQLREARPELRPHPSAAGSAEAALPGAIKEVVGADADRARLLKRLFAEAGLGRFVRAGRLTDVGMAVLTRARELGDHAIDPAPYALPALEASVEGLRPPQPEGARRPAGAELVERLLTEPLFDDARAAERLATLDRLPSDEQVAGIIAALMEHGAGDAARPADVEPEVRLAATALQLALDYRYVKRVGPEELRSAKTLLSRRRSFARVFATVQAIAEAADGDAAMELIDPAHPEYGDMLAVYKRYRAYAEGAGCEKLPESWKIRPGMKGDEVKRLQARLACEGYYEGEFDGVYEGQTLAAAKRYQRHHELTAKGFVFEETLGSLNVPMSHRVQQIAITLQRMRESPIGALGDFFIRVNLPAFELQVWDHGEVIRRHRVIIGTNRLDDDKAKLVQGHLNRTKLFTTELFDVIVHPTWILPPRVEHGELVGKIADDPKYLEKHNIKKMTLKSGREVFIQGFGEGNVLGEVKFLLRESNAIYLHDTDKRSLFKKKRRDFSHGCVRVDRAVDFAKWMLERDGFSSKEIAKAFKLTQYQRGFHLRHPIKLITEYMTVDLAPDGQPVFLTDIYKYDKAYLDHDLPPKAVGRWGGAELRPRWVPRVSEETVNRWRAEGKHAPRHYDPEIHGR